MVYHIMHMDIPLIDIETDSKHRVIAYKKLVPDSCRMQPFCGDNIHAKRLYDFLKDRCYDDKRSDLPDILAAHGMTTNDPYTWCRKTHGVTYEDFFWIKYDDEEIEWKDVRVR